MEKGSLTRLRKNAVATLRKNVNKVNSFQIVATRCNTTLRANLNIASQLADKVK